MRCFDLKLPLKNSDHAFFIAYLCILRFMHGGEVTTIYAGAGCAIFLGCLFSNRNRFWGIIFGKIAYSHKLWGVILEK